MKTYSILYSEEVPHYTTATIEAETDAEAIEKAKALDTFGMPSNPDYHHAVCRRIVSIDTDEGDAVSDGIPLDAWRLIERRSRSIPKT